MGRDRDASGDETRVLQIGDPNAQIKTLLQEIHFAVVQVEIKLDIWMPANELARGGSEVANTKAHPPWRLPATSTRLVGC